MIITFGMPIVGDLPGDAVQEQFRTLFRLGRVAEREGHEVLISCPPNILPHDRARMAVWDEAMGVHSDLIFFVDSDTLIPAGAFEELLKIHLQSKAPLVTGHYIRRGWPFTSTWSKVYNGQFQQVDAKEGIHEIDTCGLGCALVDVHWVNKNLKPPYFTMEMGERSCVVTDDVAFCTRIREAGGLILGHAGIRCIHLGNRMGICDQTASALRQMYLQQNGVNHARSKSHGEPALQTGH